MKRAAPHEIYGCDPHSLLDLDDREQMPPADMLVINSIGRAPSSAEADMPTGVPLTPSLVRERAGTPTNGSNLVVDHPIHVPDTPGDPEWTLGRRQTARSLTISLSPSDRQHRLGADFPERLRRRAARLRRLDDVLGGGETYEVYLAEYNTTSGIIQSSSYTEATELAILSILAEQAQQAGWAAFDMGNHAEASRLYKESHRHAVAARDAPLAGNALAYLAYQAGENDKRAAVELAVRSCEVAGTDAPSTVRALLFERLAWAYAITGDVRETERAMRIAETALAEDDAKPQPGWAAWVDHNELSIMKGRCWAELRRPLRAVPILEKALDSFDESHARDKSLYLSWLANAYLAAEEVEQAACVAGRVLDLSSGVASVRPRQRIISTLRQLDLHRSLPRVQEILDQAKAFGLS